MTELTSRQQEFVWSAINLIDQKGIQGLTIKNLSQSIHVSEPAIYRHFKSKVDILIAIIDMFKSEVSKIITDKQASSEPIQQRLQVLLNGYAQFFAKNPAVVSVIFAEDIFQNEPALSAKLTEIIRKNETFLTQLIKEGQEKGEIRNDIDPSITATSILGTFRLTVKKWKLNGYKYSIMNEAKRVNTYFQSILAN